MSEAVSAGGPTQGVVRAAAAAVIVIAGLKLGAPVLIPIAFALFLAVLSFPLFRWMLDRRVPVPLAILATVAVLGSGIALFVVLAMGSLSELRETGPVYYASLQERLAYTVQWWQDKGIAVNNWLPPRWRDPDAIVKLAGVTLKSAFVIVSEATVIVLVLVFFLGEAAVFPRKLERLPPAVRESFAHFAQVSSDLQRYLVIKTVVAAVVGVCCGAWVALLGVDFPVLWGLVAFACHFVPNIGAVLAAAPAMLVALVQFDAGKSLAVVVGYLVIGLALGNLLEPSLLGRRLGLSTLVVFLSLVFWGWLWGPVGMFLSVPLTMAFRILMAHSRDWRWVATLLDAALPLVRELLREPSPALPGDRASAESR